MKLVDRDARARFYVINPSSGETLEVDPKLVLAEHQALKMASRPDMILQFAHYLASTVAFYGTKPLRVEARVLVSLNGRKPQLLVDQNLDLAKRTANPEACPLDPSDGRSIAGCVSEQAGRSDQAGRINRRITLLCAKKDFFP